MDEAEIRKRLESKRTKISISQAHDSLYFAPALDFTLTRWEVMLLRILTMLILIYGQVESSGLIPSLGTVIRLHDTFRCPRKCFHLHFF